MRTLILIILTLLPLLVTSQIRLEKKNESCAGKNDGSIEVKSEGLDPGSLRYKWNNGANTRKISGLKPGDYSVTVSTGSNCMTTKHARVFGGPEFSVSLSPLLLSVDPDPLPCGERPVYTYRLTLSPHGGKPPYYCSWGAADPGDGTCQIVVSGSSINVSGFMSDSNKCADSEGWKITGLIRFCPRDPNDISGPIGHDSVRWVSRKDEMDYTVRFENDPIFATSNAATVLVTVPIDDDIDPFSFRLGSLGFGDKIITIPNNSSFSQQRIDYTEDLGFLIDITAGLDLPNNRYFWLIETIDPLTGQPPTDPLSGFLPVNDTLTGSGEGFVTFSCKPKSNTPTGEIVNHQASIIFDLNDPILTNIWSNKIDAVAPSTLVTPLADTFFTNMIPFTWLVNDDPGGCGVMHSEVFISTNRNDFTSYGYIFGTNSQTLILDWGRTYYYKVTGTDFVENHESGIIDSFYIIPQRAIEFIIPDTDVYCAGDTLPINIELVSIASVDLSISIDSGLNFTPLATGISEWPYNLVLGYAYLYPEVIIKARNNAANLEALSSSFSVNALPVIDAGAPVSGCDNEILFVEADGGNTYYWWPDSIIGNQTGRFSNVYADMSQYAYVRGTDVNGCSNLDSVFLTVYSHSRDTISQPLCEGDSIFINGEWILAEGFYETIYSDLNQCDSIIVSNVIFQNPCIWSGGPYVFVNDDATGQNNGTSWTHAFTDLQDAIYVAGRYENVQEIWVAQGVYHPHATRRDTSFMLKDSIKIFGGFIGIEAELEDRTTNAELVQISGDINIQDTLWDNSFHTLQVTNACVECMIDGVTIQYGHADVATNSQNIGAGILNKGKARLYNVIFERNFSTDMGAALHSSGVNAELTIESCMFRLNTSSLGRDVVNLSGSQIRFEGVNGMY